jgi:hypothetical protein
MNMGTDEMTTRDSYIPSFPQFSRLLLSPDFGGDAGGSGSAPEGGETAAPGGTATATAPAAPAIPDGHRLVPESEWSRLQQEHGTYRGYAERLGRYGFDRPEKLDEAGELLSMIGGGKINPKLLAQAWAAPQEQRPQGDEPEYLTAEQFEQKLAERERRNRILSEHEAAEKGWHDTFGKKLAEILGDDADDDERAIFENAARGMAYAAREKDIGQFMYPEGHPLRDERLAPFNDQNTKSVWETLSQLRTKMRGGVLARIGDAANKQTKQSTPAGGSGGGGKHTEPDADTQLQDVVKASMRAAGIA